MLRKKLKKIDRYIAAKKGFSFSKLLVLPKKSYKKKERDWSKEIKTRFLTKFGSYDTDPIFRENRQIYITHYHN